MTDRQMAMAARILLHNVKQGPAPAADHVEYCGRGRSSVLGNPFTNQAHTRVLGAQVVGSREEAIAHHREWLREELRAKTKVYGRIQVLARQVAQGQTICLTCFCLPQRCHTETLREAVAWYAARDGMATADGRSVQSPSKP
ncbi:DUF4326 domain-containing protein [Deinococcus multiflagellatus]|uniref:DUF4326 domain-containing protein n=1 Tax=Deinococcus multiflagellatus TaxID=1656887 RepID=A0ABW1ZSC7_9DEIO|nr:DUF4326 domain-containing protein [Deinococcus multiflagellatus]MBZ9715792.1 DUF4326 domain-containing protein [Deinococcus multiflagellatus]